MVKRTKRTLIARVLGSRVLWAVVAVVLIIALSYWTLNGLSGNVHENQEKFVEDNVRRSAIQCYAIEGRFPNQEAGLQYLIDNYGLVYDSSRFVVHYEYQDNRIPTILVISATAKDDTAAQISSTLGVYGGGE